MRRLELKRLAMICAVAALAATALPFAAQAYCRGCVIESAAKPAANPEANPENNPENNPLTARAEVLPDALSEALPEPPVASCHIEKRVRTVNGQSRTRRVEICE